MFLHNDAIHIKQPSNISALRGDGNGQSGQEDSGRHPEDGTQARLSSLSPGRYNMQFYEPKESLPLHLLLGEILAHFSRKVIEPVEGAGVEKGISRFPEHSRDLVVVVGHKLGFGWLLGKSKQAMDVLNSFECFLERVTHEDINSAV